jgi:transcriptional regulator with XRE-family HTH domain
MAKFCERIKALRIERGLKQREMAKQFGLALSSYQAYEYATRYPEFPGLIAIADFFDVSLDYLVGRSDVRERQ